MGSEPQGFYVEMVQPADAARRIACGTAAASPTDRNVHSMRYELFGHDLEKGVILRARLRGTLDQVRFASAHGIPARSLRGSLPSRRRWARDTAWTSFKRLS